MLLLASLEKCRIGSICRTKDTIHLLPGRSVLCPACDTCGNASHAKPQRMVASSACFQRGDLPKTISRHAVWLGWVVNSLRGPCC